MSRRSAIHIREATPLDAEVICELHVRSIREVCAKDYPPATIEQKPPFSQSSSRPKTLAESIRGMQHQSIEPSRLTSAVVWQSLISA